MSKITIISKKSHQKIESIDTHVGRVKQNSVVKLKVSRDDIALIKRETDHMIVTLKNGETIVIENFFHSEYSDNSLVLVENDGSLYWVKYTHGEVGIEQIIEYSSISDIGSLLYTKSSYDGPFLWHYGAAAGVFALSVTSIKSALKFKNTPEEIYLNNATAKNESSLNQTESLDTETNEIGPVITSSALIDNVQLSVYITQLNDTNDNTPTISGTTELDSKVNVVIKDKDGNPVAQGQATIDDVGNWSFTPSDVLPDGEYTVEVSVEDKAGNRTISQAQTLNIDTVQPTVSITKLNATNDNTPTISGTTELDSKVTVVIKDKDGNPVAQGQATIDDVGNLIFTPSDVLPDGEYTIEVSVEDKAGNRTISQAQTLKIDTVQPTVSITQLNDTNDNTPTISGTTELDSKVNVVIKDKDGNPVAQGQATIDDVGNWSFPPSDLLPDGEYTVEVSVEDKAGNSTISQAQILKIDTVQPTVSITQLNDTNDNTPTISGTTELDSKVTVVIKDKDGNPVAQGQATIDDAGNWSFTPSDLLPDGEYTVEVSVEDKAGNDSKVVDVFNIDTVIPDYVSINEIGTTNQQFPQLTGTAEPNAFVNLMIEEISGSSSELVSLTVDATGQWRYTPEKALPEGVIKLTVNAQDAAGNIGSNTTSDFVIDLTPPSEPVAEINSDGSIVIGYAQAGALVIVRDLDNNEFGREIADSYGQYSIPLSSSLNDGQRLEVIAQDVAGDSKPTILTAPLIQIDAMNNVAKAWINTVFPTETTLEKEALEYSWTVGFFGLNFGSTNGSKYISNSDGSEIVIELQAKLSVLIGVENDLEVKLYKKNNNGQWNYITGTGADTFFGIFHGNSSAVDFKFEAQGAGDYRVDVYSSSIAGLGGSVSVDFTTTIINKNLPKEFKSIAAAQGNVMTDLDPIYGLDLITQNAFIRDVNGIQIDQDSLINGEFGDLVMSSNGAYTYTPKGDLTVIGLTETFNYTVIDSITGKSDTAKLVVQIDTADITVDSLKNEESLKWSVTNPEAYANDDIALDEDLAGEHSTYDKDEFSFQNVSSVIYRVLNENSPSGGNGMDYLEHFELNSNHNINISKLLSSNFDRANIGEFVVLKHDDQNTVLSIDRDGEQSTYQPIDLLIIKNAQLSLEDLINSNQLIF